jgi:hypothetical protein
MRAHRSLFVNRLKQIERKRRVRHALNFPRPITSRGNTRQDIVRTTVIGRSFSPSSPMSSIALDGFGMPIA